MIQRSPLRRRPLLPLLLLLLLLASGNLLGGCGTVAQGDLGTGSPVDGAADHDQGHESPADQGTDSPEVEEGQYGLVWVSLPGGSFLMGQADRPTASPVHPVSLAPFALTRTEVTIGQLRRCIAAGACARPTEGTLASDDGDPARAELPVDRITWFAANSFCQLAGGTLPTEAQWEYAARGAGRHEAYPWGATPPSCERAVHSGGSGCVLAPQPVCSRPAGNSPQGLCDLLGNAAEWVADCWHEGYDGAPADGSSWGGICFSKVQRGGKFSDVAQSLDARLRGWEDPDFPAAGFRCARPR